MKNLLKTYKKITIRHGLVSLICGSTELALFTILISTFSDYIYLIYLISFSIATFIGFVLHSKYTFMIGELKINRGLKFIMQASFILTIGVSIFTLILKFDINPIIAKITQLAVTFSLNVIIGRKITFTKD